MVNSPLPTDLAGECKKASKILNSFIDPVAAKGPDKVIPPNILQRAKGFKRNNKIKPCSESNMARRIEREGSTSRSAFLTL
ncbi:11262_t:CDS:2 [Entrophospora sp. SA101]|nr:11262_t:CDS:2 [Entrophospora sp. SA101]